MRTNEKYLTIILVSIILPIILALMSKSGALIIAMLYIPFIGSVYGTVVSVKNKTTYWTIFWILLLLAAGALAFIGILFTISGGYHE